MRKGPGSNIHWKFTVNFRIEAARSNFTVFALI
jgi:hypothetical protein